MTLGPKPSFLLGKLTQVEEDLFSLLTEEDRQKLQAKAEQEFRAERKKEAERAYLAKAKKALQSAEDPNEEMRFIMLDLAGHADHIRLDDHTYYHGRGYEVTRRVYNTLQEIQQKTWQHERSCGYPNRDLYQPARSTVVGPGPVNAPRQVTINGRTGAIEGANGLESF